MGEQQASVTTDSAGWFKAVSPAFLELIGAPVESLAGVNIVDLVHPLDAPMLRQLIAHVPVSGSPATFSARLLAAGDIWRPCSVHASPAPDDRIIVEFATATSRVQSVATQPAATPDVPERVVSIYTINSARSFEDVLQGNDGTVAGDDVPRQRVAVRAQVDADTPLLEIDSQGRTTFATGPWADLGEHDSDAATAFEELIERTGTADVVLDLVSTVTGTGVARQVEAPMVQGSRWIQVLPIPSPYRADELHALIAVTPAKADGEQIANASSATITEPFTSPAAAVTPAADIPADTSQPQPVSVPLDGPDLVDTPADAALSEVAEPPAKKRRGFFGWLLLGIAGLLAIVIISKLWPSSEDGAADTGPVEVAIALVDPVEVDSGQTWRPTGVGSAGESHGIATVNSGAYLAGTNGTIVRLDTDGAAVSAVTLGDAELTFVSDIDADASQTVWALDAGEGRLFRISDDGSVVQVSTDPLPLRNARGIGMSADGGAWIASTASAQLVKIASDGAVTNAIPLPGRQASDVIEVADGTLWIVDAQEIELVHLSTAGEVLGTVRPEGFTFTSPTSPHLAIVEGSLWVSDPEMSAAFEIDLETGEETGERVVLTRPGDVRVDKAIGIDSDASGRLWIADSIGVATTIVDR